MDVTRILEADHAEAQGLLERISTADGEERLGYLEQLAASLRDHMELEETTMYPVISAVLDQAALDEANTEHELTRGALADVMRLAPDEPGFGAALDALTAALAHHIRDEETDVFPALRSDERALEATPTPFLHKRLALGMQVPAAALAAACSKEELRTEAEAAGVAVAASATKAELAEALSAKMAT